MRGVLTIGFLLGVGHYAFMFYAIHVAGSLSSVAIAAQLTVPFSTILAIVFLGERIRLVRALAIAASFGGVVVIGLAPVGGPDHALALGLTTVASGAMAVAAILMRRLSGVGTFNLQGWIALCATLSMAGLTYLIERPDLAFLAAVPPLEWWTAAYSAIGATIVGHGLLYWLLQRYPVNDVAPFITLSTLFAIGFGVWLAGRCPDPAHSPRRRADARRRHRHRDPERRALGPERRSRPALTPPARRTARGAPGGRALLGARAQKRPEGATRRSCTEAPGGRYEALVHRSARRALRGARAQKRPEGATGRCPPARCRPCAGRGRWSRSGPARSCR